ncbi:MAG: PilZ domain-containing protein [Kiloniellales bacterium]|nr:PilZ domain-containing protein [Kiloniellales bacterium]
MNDQSRSERRRHGRAKVLWTGNLDHGNRTSDCVVLNIGPHGAMARSLDLIPRGSRVMLQSFHFGRLAAEIVWQDGNALGLCFKDNPAAVRRALGWQLPELRLEQIRV